MHAFKEAGAIFDIIALEHGSKIVKRLECRVDFLSCVVI